MHRHTRLTIVASGLAGLMLIGASAHEPPAAAAAGSAEPLLGCVRSPQDRAMAVHDLHPDLIADGDLNAVHPEARIYDAIQDGELRCGDVALLRHGTDAPTSQERTGCG